jgi:alpha-D-ribose 1-methylphosphonate 5-triphosphate diphosphatase
VNGSKQIVRADGLLALPGLVDIHGDAFERQLKPRPEVRFDAALAMADTDRQLAANGITTAFHGVTWSWEGGLRGRDSALELIGAIRARRGLPGVDHRVHLRFENHNVAESAEVGSVIEAGEVDFLAFNDHLSDIAKKCERPEKRAAYADRAEVDVSSFLQRLHAASERTGEVAQTVEALARIAAKQGVAMASHDDLTAQDRQRYAQLGAHVSEFPRSLAALKAARQLSSAIILGAPNILRGGSHCGGVNAADMVMQEQCDILASDYYYPALLVAPFLLVKRHGITFQRAWGLVSANPARAAGLRDRGTIADGQRADLVLVDDSVAERPQVVACYVAGVAVYLSRNLAH